MPHPDPPPRLQVVVPPLQAADKELLPDRDPARGLLGDDRHARDEARDGRVPRLEVGRAERAWVVQAEGVERPFAGWVAVWVWGVGGAGGQGSKGRRREKRRSVWEGQCARARQRGRGQRGALEESEEAEHAAKADDVGAKEGMEDEL